MLRKILLASLLALTAANAAEVETIAAARAAASRGDWKAALGPFAQLVAQSPGNGEFRLSLARARYLTGDIAGAEADYKAAFDLKAEDPAVLAYGIAKCAAELKRNDEAMTWLRKAVALGFRRIEDARSDDAFAALRGDGAYRKLVGLVDPGTPRDEGWRSDIHFLADQVEHRAYHPFRSETADRYVSAARYTRDEFESEIRKLADDVPKLSDIQIETALFKLVASLGDGHSAVEGSRTRAEFALTLPVSFYVFADGLYIVASAKPDLVGAKVLAFDGVPAKDVMAKLDPLIAHDNAQWVKAMEPTFLRHLPFLNEAGKSVTLTVELRGKKSDVEIAADMSAPDIWNTLPKPAGWTWIGDASKSDFQQGNDKTFWWKWEPEHGILYVQYNKVADAQNQTLAAFARELSEAIAKYPVAKLVIDMRNNNGGDTYLNEPLLEAVAGNPKVNRVGHLYVIVGRRTFSAAMNAVSDLGRFTKAIFVGEPTGGKPNAPGDEVFFTLPYSGILANLSDRYWQGSWPDDFSDTRAPDIFVPETFADAAVGRDGAMAIIEAQPDLP